MSSVASRAEPPAETARAAARLHREVVVYVVLAIGLSWVPWLLVVAGTGDPTAGGTGFALWALGGLGPGLAAAAVAVRNGGRAGLRRLFAGLLRWRVGRWYLLLLWPAAIAFAAVGISVLVTPETFDLAGLGAWYLIPGLVISGVLFGGLEEIGWRGYLLPRLQRRWSALSSSVVVGLVWSLWHAPLFWMEGTAQASFSAGWFTLQAVALSILLTWAYNGTGGSLLLVVLAHVAVNAWYTIAVEGFAPGTIDVFVPVAAILTGLAAVAVVWWQSSESLSSQPRVLWGDDDRHGS